MLSEDDGGGDGRAGAAGSAFLLSQPADVARHAMNTTTTRKRNLPVIDAVLFRPGRLTGHFPSYSSFCPVSSTRPNVENDEASAAEESPGPPSSLFQPTLTDFQQFALM